MWALSPSLWPWPTDRKIYCQKSALEGLYHTISCLSLYSPGAHNIINWIQKIMVQFSTLSLSLPPIPNILRATSPSSQDSAIHVFLGRDPLFLVGLVGILVEWIAPLVLDYHPHAPPPPTLPEKVWLDAVYTVSRKRLNKAGMGHTVILTEGEVALFS